MMITFRVSLTDVKDDTEEYYSKKVKKVFEAPKGPKGRWWWLTSSNETKAALALRDDDDTKSLSLPCARKRGGLFGPKASFLSSQSRVLFCGIQIHFPHHYWSSNVASSSPAAGTTTRALFFPSLSLSLCDSSPYVLCVVSFVAFALSERALFCDVGEMVVVRSLTRRFPIIIIIIIIIIFCCRRLRRRVQ